MAVTIPVDPMDSAKSLRDIGAEILSYQPLRNAFTTTLVNKFAFSILTSKPWRDRFYWMQRGTLDYGETIEEIFVDLADVQTFSYEEAESRELRKYDADVYTAYYSLNWAKQYPVSISEVGLRQAFMSYGALYNYISGVIQSLYKALEYDVFTIKKYMICRYALNGGFPLVTVDDIASTETAQANVVKLRSTVDNMGILSTRYNLAGVHNSDEMDDLFIVTDNDHRAYVDVMVDAMAYNRDKVSWLGHVESIDSFYEHDTARLEKLLEDDYEPFTEEETTSLQSLNFVILARDAMGEWVNQREMRVTPVNSGAYLNYFLSNWETIAISPFGQKAAFAASEGSITSVTVSPDTATMSPGGMMLFTATVEGDAFCPKGVTWSVEGAEAAGTKMDGNQLTISENETATTLTVVATAHDGTTTGSATVTVQSE